LQVPNPAHFIYTYPKFFSAMQVATAVRNGKGEMCLMLINISTNDQQQLTEWSMDPVGFISVEGKRIYFTRTEKGTDQGFYILDHQIFSMITDAFAGNYQLSGGYGKLAWNSLTSAGNKMQIESSSQVFSSEPIHFSPVDTTEKHAIYALDHPPFQIPFPIPDSIYPVKPYQSTTHLFNFHSWRPFISDPDYTLSLLGQNVLNSFQSEIYVGYNRNEQYKKLGVDFTYGGLFPFINLGSEYMIDRNGYFNGSKIYWNELLSYTGITIPLNFSRGRWLTTLEGGASLAYHQRFFLEPYKDSISHRSYLSLDPQVFFSHALQAGRMQINPSFAQTLLLQYEHALSNISGRQFLASANFYLPGIVSTNSLVINTAFQQRDSSNQIRYSNSFPFARGYSGENFYKMIGIGINYNLPLFYPDWGFANMIYFLRVRANAFFDYTGVPDYATNGRGVSTMYRSFGLEIYFDTQWWNQLPLSFGVRYSRLLDPDYEGRSPNQWELVLPLNILSSGYSHH